MKKNLVLISVLVLGIFVFAGYAHADNISAPTPADQTISTDTISTVTVDPTQDLTDQITLLQLQQQDPTNGPIENFFIHLKIRNLENKLNLQKALQ